MGNYILGIDLAAKEKNPTGVCYYDDKLELKILRKDEEIIDLIKIIKPKIVLIDAPLSLEKIPYRDSERELLKRGFRPLPLTMRSMRELAERAIRLKEIMEKDNIKVFETFPRAVEKILNLNYEKLKPYFKVKHLYDAWLCYLTGIFYKINKYENIKGIILPKI